MEDETKPLLIKAKETRGPRLGKFLPLKVKGEIIKKLNEGVKPLQLTKEYNIAPSTVSRLKKCKKSIQKAINTYRNDTHRRSVRGTFHPKMENALHKWYLEQKKCGVDITTNAIRVKAREFYTKLRENNLEFRASAGWVEKFKRRYGIRLKGAYKKKPLQEEDEDSDNNSEDANGEQEIDEHLLTNIKVEDPFEPTFVDVLADAPVVKTEQLNGVEQSQDILQSMEDVIQWTIENQIEPLYLTMLRSLQQRMLRKNEQK